MDIGNFINGLGINGGSVLNTPKRPSENRGGFWSALAAANVEKPGSSDMLYAAARVVPSDEDIEALAASYNPSDMTGTQYRAFLDELEQMDAITPAEHKWMTGCFMDGETDMSGDLLKKLQTMPSSSPEEFVGLGALNDIVKRMDWAINGKSLMEQATDADGKFWLDLRSMIIESAKEKEEQKKEEEKLELLNLMLDNMTGKDNPRVSAATGLRLGMNADQDIIKSGYMPTELHAYLLTLGGNTTYEMVEEPEDEDGKVQEVEEASAEKLYANSEKRQNLPEDVLADLAKKYDPNNMDREQYDQFLEEMVQLGVAKPEMIESLGYHGTKAVHTGEEEIPFVSEVPYAQNFNRSPVDNDIEGWIQNRLLWKPGITRESARRAGLSKQYDHILEEGKTLSNISAILAGVKRQRYPSVSL